MQFDQKVNLGDESAIHQKVNQGSITEHDKEAFSACGVGLLLDATSGLVLSEQLFLDISETQNVYDFIEKQNVMYQMPYLPKIYTPLKFNCSRAQKTNKYIFRGRKGGMCVGRESLPVRGQFKEAEILRNPVILSNISIRQYHLADLNRKKNH